MAKNLAFLGKENLYTLVETKLQKVIEQSRLIEGPITRYVLNTTNVINDKYLRRERFGEKDEKKPHKTILLVGETGVGKSTLINAMVTYLLGVRCNDRIWFEIIETKEKQFNSQTEVVTVYDVFFKESPISLTIIDSPGFSSTEGKEQDLEIANMILELCKSTDGVQEINVVGLVLKSETTRLTENQQYVFDSVLSLFGCDVEKNIVLFVTHASTKPRNVIEAVKRSKVPCAKNDKGEPVYFRFDNFHCEDFSDKDVLDDYEDVWNVLSKSMDNLLDFTNNRNTVSLKLTEVVLRQRKTLMSSISNLKDRITEAELKNKELEQTKAALQQHEKQKADMNNFEYEVDETYKTPVTLPCKGGKKVICCTVCEENCHYPGFWFVGSLYWCSVMRKGKCTVCTGKCHHSEHKKSGKIYKVQTRRVKKTMEDIKKKYETDYRDYITLITKLKDEIDKQNSERIRLVEECYHCVISLKETALHGVSETTLQHLDFLIERVKETGKRERVQEINDIKKRAESKHQEMPT